MIEFLTTLPDGLTQLAFWVLVVMSFVGSFITAALGIVAVRFCWCSWRH